MSDMNKLPLATGGMSNQGTTTVVRVNRPKLDIPDKAAICPVVCKCNKAPDVGVDGRSLKQACVSKALSAVDKAADHKSWYKPEVNYDMTKSPPAPIMSSSNETKGHEWLPGWISKRWDQDPDHPPFLAGEGMIRRPDVIIVRDPSKPPAQDNIKQVVEIKFPPDEMGDRQRKAYERIAGDSNKVVEIGPDDCDCSSGNNEQNGNSTVPSPDAKTMGAGMLLMMALGAILAL